MHNWHDYDATNDEWLYFKKKKSKAKWNAKQNKINKNKKEEKENPFGLPITIYIPYKGRETQWDT